MIRSLLRRIELHRIRRSPSLRAREYGRRMGEDMGRGLATSFRPGTSRYLQKQWARIQREQAQAARDRVVADVMRRNAGNRRRQARSQRGKGRRR